MSCPSTITWPPVGAVSPAIRCSTVLFPEPLGPMSAQNAPLGQMKLRSSTARTAVSPVPKVLVTPRNSTILGLRLEPLLQLARHVVEPRQLGAGAELCAIDEQVGDEGIHGLAGEATPLHTEQVQLLEVRIALVLHELDQLGHALAAGEKQLDRQLLP